VKNSTLKKLAEKTKNVGFYEISEKAVRRETAKLKQWDLH
jgi:hypothetical protein